MMKTNKRKSNEKVVQSPNKQGKKSALSEDSILYKDFTSYQRELDARNDKHERLVKISRDVTIHSKRAIFSLLRKGIETSIIVSEGQAKISDIKNLLEKASNELIGEDIHKFHRAYTNGVQEFVEAISLLYYVQHSKVITYTETKQLYFQFENGINILTHVDFMLGIADLTGELMRMAINAVGNGEFPLVGEICVALQEIHSSYAVCAANQRELSRKLNVMRNSVKKVENACYNLKVRGSEIPVHLLTNLLDDSKEKNIEE